MGNIMDCGRSGGTEVYAPHQVNWMSMQNRAIQLEADVQMKEVVVNRMANQIVHLRAHVRDVKAEIFDKGETVKRDDMLYVSLKKDMESQNDLYVSMLKKISQREAQLRRIQTEARHCDGCQCEAEKSHDTIIEITDSPPPRDSSISQ